MVIQGPKTATFEDGNAVYAALLETPRGQYIEANLGDHNTIERISSEGQLR